MQFVLFCFTVTGVKEIKYRVNTISKVKQEKWEIFWTHSKKTRAGKNMRMGPFAFFILFNFGSLLGRNMLSIFSFRLS